MWPKRSSHDPGFKIGFESRDAACDYVRVSKRKARDPRPHPWIEIRLGLTPIRGEKPIDAVVRDRDTVYLAVPEVVHEISDRGTTSAVELDNLGK